MSNDVRKTRWCTCGHPKELHSGIGDRVGTGPCEYDSQYDGSSGHGDGDCPCPKYRSAVVKLSPRTAR